MIEYIFSFEDIFSFNGFNKQMYSFHLWIDMFIRLIFERVFDAINT